MKEEFLELFGKVFDEDGNVKPCGRDTCVKLIKLCESIAPSFDGRHYGETDPDSLRRGYMNVQNIKTLRDEILAR